MLLSRLLRRPAGLIVKRIVLYDLPEEWRGGRPGQQHREWVDRLRRDLAYLGAGRPSSRYEIRQYVLATAGPRSRPPAEIAVPGRDEKFDELWEDEGFALLPGPATGAGFYGDEDPLYHLDLDVRDTDRLQIGPEQGWRRVTRDPEAEI